MMLSKQRDELLSYTAGGQGDAASKEPLTLLPSIPYQDGYWTVG